MKPIQVVTALLGLSGVLLGAFGAHAWAEQLTGRAGELWTLASQYHLIHAAVLVGLCAWAVGSRDSSWIRSGAWLMAAGVVLFSGSLYCLALSVPWSIGWVTPLGGLSLAAGWSCIAVRAIRG